MKDITWVGLDVHKETTAFAILTGSKAPDPLEGEIATNPEQIIRLLRRQTKGSEIRACYEAGPCGFELKRRMDEEGIHCDVVAPSLIPKKPGERIKTDRRDAMKLARLYRAGELTSIRVPSEAEEAARDLCRCREDAKEDLLRRRNRLSKFLLRHGRIYREGKSWTQRHRAWVRSQRFEDPNLTSCFDAYVIQVEQCQERLKALGSTLEEVAGTKLWQEAVKRLGSLRGIATLSALTLAAEVGDYQRFGHAKDFMGFVGLVPSEYSSGGNRRQGSITKTGNAHVRRVLVEAAWHYRHRPTVGRALAQRLAGQPKEVKDLSWRAQERLNLKFRRLTGRGKRSTVAVVAVARELAGFVWALMAKTPAVA